MVAATITNRKDANSQGVTPAPDNSLHENDHQTSTTTPSAFNPRDIRKQIQAGVQAPAATKATDVISAAEAAFEATSLQLREQHQQLGKVAKTTSDLRNGQVRMREEGQKEVAAYEASWSKYNPWSSRFYERGLIEQKKADVRAITAYVESLEAHEKELKSALQRSQTSLNEATTSFKESQELRKEADKALERARELAAANKEQEARTEAEKAKELTVRSLERLQEAQKLQQEALRSLPQSDQLRSIPESATAQYQQSIRASSAQLAKIDKELEQTQEYIRMARNTTIVIGATVATGGLATAGMASTYGVVGAGAITIGKGIAAGTGIGLAATAAEQGRSVAEGQKTAQAAFQDGLKQTGQDAQLALTTSVATYSGMTALSKVAPKVTTLLGGSKLAATTSTVASGSISTVPSTLLQEGLDVTVNGREFGGVADLGGKILKNGIAGGLGTSLGVLGNAARSTNAVRNVAVTGGEGLADATISVGIEASDAAIRGKKFSSKDAWATFNQAIVGTLTGEMSSKAQGRAGRVAGDGVDSDSRPNAERDTSSQRIEPRIQAVVTEINGRARLINPSEVEQVIGQFPDRQRETATALLYQLAIAGGHENLNGVMHRLKELGVRRGGAKIIDNGPGSLTDTLEYLHNRGFLPDYTDVPPTAMADRHEKRRIVNEHFLNQEGYSKYCGTHGDAVLILDNSMIQKLTSTNEGLDRFASMLNDPNLTVVVPLGREIGINGVSFDQNVTAQKLRPVVETAQQLIDHGFDQKTAFTEALIQHDPVLKSLREIEPKLLERIVTVPPNYRGANANQPEQTIPNSLKIAEALNGPQRELNPRHLQELLDSAPPTIRESILSALENQATPFSYRRIGETLRSLSTEIQAKTEGKQVFYVVSETGKSFGAITEMMRQVDPSIHANQIVTPAELGHMLQSAENQWRKRSREWSKMDKNAQAQHPELAPGPKPNPKHEVAVVILDDFAGTGGSLGKAIDRVRATSDSHDAHKKPIRFEGEVIVAPVALVDGAEDTILFDKETKHDRNATIVVGERVGSLLQYQLQSSDPSGYQTAHGGMPNLGHKQTGSIITFPFSGPNNNSLLGNWFAKQTILPSVVKPPSAATDWDYKNYLKRIQEVIEPLRAVGIR